MKANDHNTATSQIDDCTRMLEYAVTLHLIISSSRVTVHDSKSTLFRVFICDYHGEEKYRQLLTDDTILTYMSLIESDGARGAARR